MIELTNLSALFGEAAALRNANLVIERGDRLGIVGESGSHGHGPRQRAPDWAAQH